MMARITISAVVDVPVDELLKNGRKALSNVHRAMRADATRNVVLKELLQHFYLPSTPCKFGPLYVHEWEVRRAKQIKILETRNETELELDRQLWEMIDAFL